MNKKLSEEGVEFLIKEEGERFTAYRCQAGVLTIGIGHTGKEVIEGMKISKDQSRELLKKDLEKFEKVLNKIVKVEITQYQFDALISLMFNIGVYAFEKSTLIKKINSNADILEVEKEFRKWKIGGGKILLVLQKRREREIKLYRGELC